MSGLLQRLYDWIVTNWKTTAAGLVTSFAALLVNYGIDLSPETQAQLTLYLTTAGLALIGLLAKDGDDTPEE